MIKLIDILENKILVPRRGKEERSKNFKIATQKKIQQYIKDGGEGDLDLNNTPLTSLPDNLKVGGDLYLDNTSINSLPNNLKVGGSLNLGITKITSFPYNLQVGGRLYLYDTSLTSLPDNLQVGGYLDLSNTPLSKKYSKEEIKKMIEDKGGEVKGEIYI